MTDKKKVIISPFGTSFYTYVDMLKDMFTYQGCDVIALRKAAKTVPPFSGVDEVVFNWFDEIPPCSPAKARFIISYKRCVLAYLKACGVKLTVVVHNVIGHNGGDEKLNSRLRKLCCDYANRIVILSRRTEALLERIDAAAYKERWVEKIQLIKHSSNLRIGETLPAYVEHSGEDFTFLFVGTVNRYKNIGLILDVAKYFSENGLNARFLIAGSSSDVAYLDEVADLVASLPNVTFENRIVPDEEMADVVTSADVLLLPYDIASSINSGTCVLAYTFGRTTICPAIGTTDEYPGDLTYTYIYTTQEEHRQMLIAAAEKAYKDWQENPSAFVANEKELQRITNIERSQEVISREWVVDNE